MSGGSGPDTSSPEEASPADSSPVDDAPAFDTSVAHSARVYDYWLGRNLQVF
jgi:S-adenosyl methyltransferase